MFVIKLPSSDILLFKFKTIYSFLVSCLISLLDSFTVRPPNFVVVPEPHRTRTEPYRTRSKPYRTLTELYRTRTEPYRT